MKVHQRKALRLPETPTNGRTHHLLESMYRVCGVACKGSALCARIEVKRGKSCLVCGYLWACRTLRYLAGRYCRKIYWCGLGKDRNRRGRRRNRCRCRRRGGGIRLICTRVRIGLSCESKCSCSDGSNRDYRSDNNEETTRAGAFGVPSIATLAP